jgi:hypothetical protein
MSTKSDQAQALAEGLEHNGKREAAKQALRGFG